MDQFEIIDISSVGRAAQSTGGVRLSSKIQICVIDIGKELNMSKGIVKEYNPNRGCGIIVDFDTGKHFNVYANYIKAGEMLKEGQEVEFDKESSRHNDSVINVRILLEK